MRKIFVLVLLLSGLAACQGSGETANVETPPVAEGPTDTSPTAAPTATSAPANTPQTAVSPTTDQPAAPTAAPETAVSAIQLVPIADGYTRPTYLTHAGDDRLFIVEERGLITIIQNGERLNAPFLNIQDRVNDSENEQGLLSMAFHPNYGENGRFYVNYTNQRGSTVVSHFLVSSDDPNRANAGSEEIILTILQPFGNHNGGQLQFGPDGYLYIGMGDGGSGGDPNNNGQNPATLLGGLLRIDVDNGGDAKYAIPADNPFANDDGKRSEIWAYGLRNPWRFSFDRKTGDLYIADVGQGQWEEVHAQPADSPGGENYGWNILEGSHCFRNQNCDTTGLELPAYEYDHSQGCSITGGYVYRGQQYPTLRGNYFFTDYCTGIIWSLFREADGSWTGQIVLRSNLNGASFGEDVNGELYILDHQRGGVYQIRP